MQTLPKILILLLICAASLPSQNSWTKKHTNTSMGLTAIKFRTNLDGWAVGEKGTILHTTDGGETWKADSVQYLGVRPLLSFVEIQDSLIVWTGSWASPTFRTTNGGASWAQVTVDSLANPRIRFLNSQVGFAVFRKSNLGTIAEESLSPPTAVRPGILSSKHHTGPF